MSDCLDLWLACVWAFGIACGPPPPSRFAHLGFSPLTNGLCRLGFVFFFIVVLILVATLANGLCCVGYIMLPWGYAT